MQPPSSASSVSAQVASRWREAVAVWPELLGALGFRLGCYAAMTALALANEYRPAPTVPDVVVGWVPYVGWVDRLNYVAWLVLYVPLSLTLLALWPRRWARYMVTGGLVSLARGVCIALTGLGPPDPGHSGPGVGDQPFLTAYVDLLSPVDIFARGSARAYLTKDLFFSGHTATTFLLVLYLWPWRRLRVAALVAHAVVVSTVVLAHLHYTIDIVGAYAFTFALFALREWQPRPEPQS